MKKILIIVLSFFLINNFAFAAGGDSGESSSKVSMYDEAVKLIKRAGKLEKKDKNCLLYTSPSPRDLSTSRMPSSA